MSEPETVEPAEEGGFLRQSFLGHLEDLRQALVKCAWSLGLALVLCLLCVDKITWVLEYPLRHMQIFAQPRPTVAFALGKNILGPYEVSREQFAGLPEGAAPHAVFRVGTAKVGEAQVLTLALEPAEAGPPSPMVRLRNYGPAEAFYIAFKVALYAAFVLSAPFWLFFAGQFILPALKVREKGFLRLWLGWGVLLFFLGVATTYFLLLPVALRASVEYSHLLGFEATEWRAEEYISFCTNFMLGMGFGFQFPLVLLTLVKIGLIDHRFLAKYRRHALVLSFVLGAVLTTPEVITQVAMALPLYLLYESCIWIAWYWERKKKRRATAAG